MYPAYPYRCLGILRGLCSVDSLRGRDAQFSGAAILSGIVLLECAILAMNDGRCPLTNLASRYTDDRRDNFDIYLPLWLARNNKSIFGTIFVLGELLVLALWLRERG